MDNVWNDTRKGRKIKMIKGDETIAYVLSCFSIFESGVFVKKT